MTKRSLSDTLRDIHVGTAAQWRAAGISQSRLTTLIRAGQLVQLRHGVYATRAIVAETAADPRRRHALEVAAVTTARTRAGVASHHSAALIHGLDLLRKPPDGRTVADLARTATFMEAVVVADSALRGRLATKAELRRVLGYCARWPGVEQARRVADFSHPLAESVLESCARVVFHAHGLPRPALQVNIGGREFIGRVDFCWMPHQTIAEADGLLKYQGRAEAIAELRRDRLLREAGFEVVHLTWREVFGEPDRVVARIREAFERSRRLRG